MYEELNYMGRANAIFDSNKNEIIKMYENGITIKHLDNIIGKLKRGDMNGR
jgi:NADH/NAD ratio-sensing transcriptional regulator Rex